MALTLKTGPRVQNLNSGKYRIVFGSLFQGRKATRAAQATETLVLESSELYGESFEIQVPEGEKRFSVHSALSYVMPGAEGTPIIVSVTSYKIGTPDISNGRGTPSFVIYFPGQDLSITVELSWTNYWVIATINPPVKVSENAMFEKWAISVTTSSGMIPQGEKVSVEVLIDDPEQFPTPVRKLTSTGDYDMLAESGVSVSGRRGVMVTFDASLAAINPGATATTQVYLKKSDTPRTAYMHFGEHSDRGIYTSTSEYIQLGTTNGKLDFSIRAVIQSSGAYSEKVLWFINKENIPQGSINDTVTMVVGIPMDSGKTEWFQILFDAGSDSKDIGLPVVYTKNPYGQGTRTITPIANTSFNERSVNFSLIESVIIQQMAQGTVVDPSGTSDVYITGITGAVVNGTLVQNASIQYDWNKDHEYYTSGGMISITHVLVSRDALTNEIIGVSVYPNDMTVKTFSITDKVKLNVACYYEMFLQVKSVSQVEGQDPAPGYAPFEYFLEAGSLRIFGLNVTTFRAVTGGEKILNFTSSRMSFTIPSWGFVILYDFFTGKFYADGLSGKATSGDAMIATLSGVPLPEQPIYLKNLKIYPDGNLQYSDGLTTDLFDMEEFTTDGIEMPVANLSIQGAVSPDDELVYTAVFQATLETPAPQNLVVNVVVTDDYLHEGVPIDFILVPKGQTSGQVSANFTVRIVSYRLTMEFSSQNNGFLFGDSPASVIVPKRNVYLLP